MTALQRHSNQLSDADLAQKASELLASPFFVGTTDDFSMAEKQTLLLVLTGDKPVAEATSGHWVLTSDGRRTVADDPIEVGKFLDHLGLAYELRTDDYGSTAVVAKSFDLVEAFREANDPESVGTLFGYPQSAIDAFVSQNLLSAEEQQAAERSAGLVIPSGFCLSRDDWQNELALVQQWQCLLLKFGFVHGLPG